MADFNSAIYPAPPQGEVSTQYVKAVVPVSFATTVSVFTVPRGQGRFFVTNILLHDPQPIGGGMVGSATISFGTASTSGTSLGSAFPLATLTGSTANQYLQSLPGLVAFLVGTTSNVTGGAVPGGDVITALVAGPNTATTTANVQVDLVGYFL